MNIVIGSAFRQSTGYLRRYLNQVASLRAHAGVDHYVRLIAVEGDSTDGTRDALESQAAEFGLPLDTIIYNHGLPWFGSTEDALRLRTLSHIGSLALAAVTDLDDVFVWVESDLIWDAHTIGSLIDMAVRRDDDFDIFSPMVFAGAHFYDIWGFRKDGERFGPFAPFARLNDGLTEIDSAGSCLVMRAEVVRRIPMKENGWVGWSEEARHAGYRLAVHRQLRIDHP